MKTPPIGVYIHTPYCRTKCAYCDFYSLTGEPAGEYPAAVERTLQTFAARYERQADSLYFGGGTPPLLGQGIAGIIRKVNAAFPLTADAEITCEVNPGAGYPVTPADLAAFGVNRLSIGLQSALPRELAVLGRRHTPQDVAHTVEQARRAGLTNYSLDLMWGIPGQTVATARQSLEFALSLAPVHLSAYLLKVEPETPFGRMGGELVLPDEDTVCEIYETCCEILQTAGLERYEISNFALPGRESRHNLKYWNCEETLGIGPAAHSFMEGKRFYYPRDLQSFLQGAPPIPDGSGGDFAEYAMLRLRLRAGLTHADCLARFGHPIPESMMQKAKAFAAAGLAEADEQGIRFTTGGNLVSNALLAELL